jgi:hypothetical protein
MERIVSTSVNSFREKKCSGKTPGTSSGLGMRPHISPPERFYNLLAYFQLDLK